MVKKLGKKFGELVKEYERARRPYPPEVFDFLKSLLTVKKPLILDLGCGTGISTRQLAELGTVIGCDPDPIMLHAAKAHKRIRNEKYVIGSASNLPFKNSSFNVVTAFAAFHWFDDKKSIVEIKRVLKLGGLIFIVNRTGVRVWGEGYRKAIIKATGRKIARFKKDYSYIPGESLRKSRFNKIRIKHWKKAELFTISNALEYVQSVSIWNSVPKSLRPKALEGLKKYFAKMRREKGKIERRLTVTAVVGVKH